MWMSIWQQQRRHILSAALLTVAFSALAAWLGTELRRELLQSGVPDCPDATCFFPEEGSALMHGILAVNAGLVLLPVVLGTVLGGFLFRGQPTDRELPAAPDQPSWPLGSATRRLSLAAAVALACSGTIAVAYRVLAQRATFHADDYYEGWWLFHRDSEMLFIAHTLAVLAAAAAASLIFGRARWAIAATALFAVFVYVPLSCVGSTGLFLAIAAAGFALCVYLPTGTILSRTR
jgi:hypothetical protein